MNDLILSNHHSNYYMALLDLALDAVDSDNTKRNYGIALREFIEWHIENGQPRLNKALVQQYKAHLQERGLAPSTINVKLAAIRLFVREAADNELMPQANANGIAAVKGVKIEGTRTGNWLSRPQAQALLEAPGMDTLKGLRDTAILGVLLGAALRREEAARLRVEHIQQRDGTWGIIDIVGKRQKVRTVPIPTWVRNLAQTWLDAAGIHDGFVLRPMRKGDTLDKTRPDSHMSGNAIWDVVAHYCKGLDFDVTPHDLRRTAAKLMLDGGAPIEQISLILGHADIKTTQRYLGVALDWDNPATYYMGLSSPLRKRTE